MQSMQNIVLVSATLATALITGLMYGYLCSVNPGLGKLNDLQYLSAVQSINKTIVNPLFFLSFIGTLILLPLATWLCYSQQPGSVQFYLMLFATGIYVFAVFGVTVVGNIPLNEALASFDLKSASASDLAQQRKLFEMPWNRFHLFRTVASMISLILVIVGLIRR